MTDRYHALTVVLETPIREEDGEALIAAIQQLRGVLGVTPHVADHTTYLAKETARAELAKQLWAVLYPESPE